MTEIILAFDVGGTCIKAAVLDRKGKILPGTMDSYPSRADAGREELLGHFYEILVRQALRVRSPARVWGVGYSFPGPFEYALGVCRLRGLGKFDALYGVHLREALRKRMVERDFPLPIEEPMKILFENDCALFALGAYRRGKGAGLRRSIFVTLGTGIGSAFLQDGRICREGPGVPENGWVYNLPFKGGILEDRISKRGLLRLAASAGLAVKTPLELYTLACGGSRSARDCFQAFGRELGEALRPVALGYRAQALILGGQVSKAHPFFLDAVQEAVGIPCEISGETPEDVYAGIFQLFERDHRED